MSDRIAYVAGNTAHRDVGNWPTILRSEITAVVGVDAETNKDELWPVDLTLAQWVAFCWRVRKWKLTGSCTASKTLSSLPATVSGTGTLRETPIVIFGPTDIEATRERDLVSRVFSSTYRALVNGGLGSIIAPIADWSTTGNLNGDWSGSTPTEYGGPFDVPLIFGMMGFTLYDPATQLFSPLFSPGLGNVIPSAFSGNQLNVSARFTRSPVTALSGTAPFVCLAPATLTVIPGITPSFTVPMQLAWRFVSEGGGATNGTGSGTFTLEAIEFWSHDGTWDTVSGAQLLDPFR